VQAFIQRILLSSLSTGVTTRRIVTSRNNLNSDQIEIFCSHRSTHIFEFLGGLEFLGVAWDWVYFARRPLFYLLNHPLMMNNDECAANRRAWRNHVTVALRKTQIPDYLTKIRTRAAAVEIQLLTASALARPICKFGKKLNLSPWLTK
jgi:hypothetical protein